MNAQEAKNHFETHLKRKGLKCTTERRALLEFLSQEKAHFTADSLFQKVTDSGLQISRDTIFRTLPLMLECGVVQKSVGQGRQEYFEPLIGAQHHDHMVCLSCHEILEFHSEAIEELQQVLCREKGFQLSFHDHRLFGYCPKCLKQKTN